MTGPVSGLVNGMCCSTSQYTPFHTPPQLIHCVQFRSSCGQKPDLDIQALRHSQALFSCVWRATVLKQHDMPSAPMRANHREKSLMRLCTHSWVISKSTSP